jgi:mono/diheme cytochrome c family protein
MIFARVLAFAASLGIASAFAQEQLSKGEYLARAGDCLVCHTMPGGRPYAGGLKMNTPGGVLHATNITPDPDTGIGKYTFAEFAKAVREGVRKDGARLYPAMPYPSYARLTDEDTRALYDFLMKEVKPVRQTNAAPELRGVYAWRWTLGLWNALGGGGAFRPDRTYDEEWNRGAYLVQGLGHCGACHTPRGWLFQEKALDERGGSFLAGGVLDNWSAPNLRGDLNTGLGRWSEEELFQYLKTGRNRFGSAFGVMRDVIVYSTRFMTDDDLRAMAKYLKSLSPSIDRTQPVWVYNNQTADALAARRYSQAGAAPYVRQCASCHGVDGKGGGVLPALAGNPAVLDPDPTSLVNIVINGAPPLENDAENESEWMPQFRTFLDDRAIADVVTFIRAAWGNRAGPVTVEKVREVRRETADAERTQIYHMR